MTGMIFDIQKFSIHDGPGIRTTVFVKGCPLRCRWCHNPESNTLARELSFMPDKCIGCGYCFAHCPDERHRMVDGKHTIERQGCRVCGSCTEQCYAEALELVGREATVQDVIAEVMRDEPFYKTSGGGLTISGGEPLMQIGFTGALLRAAKENGLHCCVETSGFGPFAAIQRIAPMVDLFLYDVKETDPDRHVEFTGVPNGPILENLRRLHDLGAEILLRLPIVPGFNDRDDHFRAVAELAATLPRLQGVEIMPYHRLGESKLQRLGKEAAGRAVAETPSAEQINSWIDRLSGFGTKVINERQG